MAGAKRKKKPLASANDELSLSERSTGYHIFGHAQLEHFHLFSFPIFFFIHFHNAFCFILTHITSVRFVFALAAHIVSPYSTVYPLPRPTRPPPPLHCCCYRTRACKLNCSSAEVGCICRCGCSPVYNNNFFPGILYIVVKNFYNLRLLSILTAFSS